MKCYFFLFSHVELRPYLQQFYSSGMGREKWTEVRRKKSEREQQIGVHR